MMRYDIKTIWLGIAIAAVSTAILVGAMIGDEPAGTSAVRVKQVVNNAAAGEIDFAREILPILSDKCFACHGPDTKRQDIVRLDSFEAATRDLGGYRALVPGDLEESEIVFRIYDDLDPMPPKDAKQLTGEEKELIERWIKQGGEYAQHWAFVPPTKPEVPEVRDGGWSNNAIDRFVFANLAEQGLKPNAEADKRRLIRRVYLDLIGLPPTPEQTDAFVKDSSSVAYEKVVDGLLASPRFGEHWAQQWLDKARYADSKGFADDRPRTMWRYRDWVIDSYNRDLPFDQFTLEQIAGDLLPDPTLDQLIATGFHRNTMTNDEGGTDNEEFRVAAVIDRTNTTMEVWMGITMACVQCHTHKYDPIQHEEYYQFFAFFNQSEDADRRDDSPYIKAPTREQQREIEELEAAYADAQAKLKEAGGEDEALKKAVSQAKKRLNDVNKRTPTALVMRDLPKTKQRKTYLFLGGSFLAPDMDRGVLKPGTPAVFHDFPKDAPRNRLGLAQWLTHPDNPLTARVQANRVWEQLWGVGLVETTEDFGFQGAWPSDKNLLDYLAFTYQHEMDWSTKSLIRLIVTSSAYRQSSQLSAQKKEIDPNNRLMTRGPRLRLTAEQIRDQALWVAGILNDEEIGGPSVTPYLPPGLLPAAFSGAIQSESKGEDLYRRGLYTLWRRSAPYASFATFDAPPRDICMAKRSRTNTPLQAFVTLNDPVYVEAAQMLGRRIISEAGDDTDTRLRHGFMLALQREPSKNELNNLRTVYTESLAEYRENPEAAKKMAVGPSPELPKGMDPADAAAMTLVGNVLLNLDELINKP